MIVESQHDYVAIGVLASHVGQSVRAIEAAVVKLGIVPAMRLNGVVHFDGPQAETITEHLRGSPDDAL